jgi:2-oxoglutarate ferredoxin oxidoreductase subunit delta
MSLIKINNSRCKSCYLCVNICPKGLIKKSQETNRLGDYLVEFDDKNEECIACAMCAKRCPDMAIEVFKG